MRHSTLLVLACLTFATPAFADDPAGPVVHVTGRASARVVPDHAVLTVAVVTERPKPADALAENAKAVTAAMAVVRAAAVPDKDIRTSELSLTAVSDNPKTGQPKVVGFRVRSEVAVEMPLSADVGGLSAKLVENGVNTIEGLALTVSDEAATRDGLRAAAARDARRQADIYASALGVKLGRVLDVNPDGQQSAPSFNYYRSAQSNAAMQHYDASIPPPPVAPGQQALEERVNVLFEIVQ